MTPVKPIRVGVVLKKFTFSFGRRPIGLVVVDVSIVVIVAKAETFDPDPGTNIAKLFDVIQCDKIGRFLKILCGKFSFKSSPNVWWHLGHFENINFEVKMAVVTFLGTFIKNGLLF